MSDVEGKPDLNFNSEAAYSGVSSSSSGSDVNTGILDLTNRERCKNDLELVVLVHGFGGSTADFSNFEKVVATNCKRPIHILKIKGNAGKTRDGIKRGAHRAFKEVCKALDTDGSNVLPFSSISIIGHSLGGMYARYLAMLLNNASIFEKITPNVFLTLATPHLGCRRQQATVMVHNITWITGMSLSGKTPRQLSMTDKGQILYKMTNENFLAPLRKFQKRVVYANIKNDFLVFYSTAAIRSANPYRSAKAEMLKCSPLFSNITQWSLDHVHSRTNIEQTFNNRHLATPEKLNDDGGNEIQSDSHCEYLEKEANRFMESETKGFRFDPKKEKLREMLKRLDSLGWERYDVLFPNSLLAHEQIINKKAYLNGKDVALHCAHVLSQSLVVDDTGKDKVAPSMKPDGVNSSMGDSQNESELIEPRPDTNTERSKPSLEELSEETLTESSSSEPEGVGT